MLARPISLRLVSVYFLEHTIVSSVLVVELSCVLARPISLRLGSVHSLEHTIL